MDLLQRSVAEYEKEFEMLEKYQITDPQDPDFGGYYNKDFGVVAQNCGSAAAKPMTLYFCPQSRYYKDPRALACACSSVSCRALKYPKPAPDCMMAF